MYKKLILIGITFVAYKFRHEIILNLNFYYRKLIKYYSPKNYIYLKNKIKINDQLIMYEYVYNNQTYITFNPEDLNIDENKNLLLTSKVSNRSSSDDIIMANMEYIDKEGKHIELDVLDDIQKLFGPSVTEVSDDMLKEYLIYIYKEIKDIISIEIMYSDGEEKKYNFLDKNKVSNDNIDDPIDSILI